MKKRTKLSYLIEAIYITIVGIGTMCIFIYFNQLPKWVCIAAIILNAYVLILNLVRYKKILALLKEADKKHEENQSNS